MVLTRGDTLKKSKNTKTQQHLQFNSRRSAGNKTPVLNNTENKKSSTPTSLRADKAALNRSVTSAATMVFTTTSQHLPCSSISTLPSCSSLPSSTPLSTSTSALPVITTAQVTNNLLGISNTSSLSSTAFDNNNISQLLLRNIINEFNLQMEKMRIEFQRQITELHTTICSLLPNINNNQTAVLANVNSNSNNDNLNISNFDKRLDSIERALCSNHIIINGVPVVSDNESLNNIFSTLCSNLGIKVPAYTDIYRKKSRLSKNSNSAIMVVLSNRNDKAMLLKAVRNFFLNNKKHLSLRNAGFDSDERIFIHEFLTKRNYHIFRAAVKKKKSNKYASVFTKDGRVFIKVSHDTPEIFLSSVGDLDELLVDDDGSHTTSAAAI